MRLNEYGRLIRKHWNDLPDHYPHIELDEFVIMPTHIHGIVIINNVGAGLKPARFFKNKEFQYRAGFKPAPTIKHHGLPEIIRAFKTFSSRQINEIKNTPGMSIWQRNYYEHVVRNEPELKKIREYIVSNPLNWESDENYKDIAIVEGKK